MASNRTTVQAMYPPVGGVQPTLVTERLRLRPFLVSDGADVERLAGARAIADTTGTIPHPYPVGAGARWVTTHADEWRQGSAVRFAIISRANGALLGAIGLERSSGGYVADLGYWIAEDAWGKGYATEASGAICAWGFATLHLQRIQAHYLTRNPKSGRVMEKLGMRFECVKAKAARKWDIAEDIACYAVLAEEWFAQPAASMPVVEEGESSARAWPRPLSAGAVLFVGDTQRVARFYQAAAQMTVVWEDPGLVVLDAHGVQLVVHAVDALADRIGHTAPPERVEDTAVKLVFPVNTLSETAARVVEYGGRMLGDDRVFVTRGFRAADACDPEGNVVQFREVHIPESDT